MKCYQSCSTLQDCRSFCGKQQACWATTHWEFNNVGCLFVAECLMLSQSENIYSLALDILWLGKVHSSELHELEKQHLQHLEKFRKQYDTQVRIVELKCYCSGCVNNEARKQRQGCNGLWNWFWREKVFWCSGQGFQMRNSLKANSAKKGQTDYLKASKKAWCCF